MPNTDGVPAEFAEAVSATHMPSAVWPVGFILALGLLVVVSLGSEPSQVEPLTDSSPAPPAAGAVPPPSASRLELLLPEADQVVIGPCVPVAGRVMPSKRMPGVGSLMFVVAIIEDGDRTRGEAMLPIQNGTFIGCVSVDAPPKGQRVALSVALTTHPVREVASVSFILAAASHPTAT